MISAYFLNADFSDIIRAPSVLDITMGTIEDHTAYVSRGAAAMLAPGTMLSIPAAPSIHL